MYVVDSNILIEAKNRYYAFDFAPGFWAWLERAFRDSLICSIQQVKNELIAVDDELSAWAKNHPDMFVEIDAKTTTHFATLTQWAQSCGYKPNAIHDFLNVAADYYLVAFSKAHGHILVTNETSAPDSKRSIKIPDACIAMGVTYDNVFSLLRATGARLTFDASGWKTTNSE